MDDASARRLSAAAAAAVFVFAWSLTTHGKYSASGDEPHYLMVAESLRTDRDLDVANNYAQNDGRLFGHDGLDMGPHAKRSRTGVVESVGDIGLPVLLLPIYSAAEWISDLPSVETLTRVRMSRGLFAYSIVTTSLVALTATCTGFVTYSLALATESTLSPLVFTFAVISPPIVPYTFLVFPETIALAITMIVLWYTESREHRPSRTALPALCLVLGLLPWIHRKYAFYAAGLLLLLWIRRRRDWDRLSRRSRLSAVLAFLLPPLALGLWSWHEWGTIGGPQMTERVPFSGAGFFDGLLGLWIDRAHGVMPCALIYAFVPAAVWHERKRAWPFLVPVALLYLPMAAYIDWTAGFSTAARYLVPTLPLLLMPLAAAVATRPRFRNAFAVAAAAQLVVDAVIWQHPRYLWPTSLDQNPLLGSFGNAGALLARAFPTIAASGIQSRSLLVPALLVALPFAVSESARSGRLLRTASSTVAT